MTGFGADRIAKKMLAQARELKTPTMPDANVEVISRVELAMSAGLPPDLWQQLVLESEARKFLLCCSRQSGKSTVAALLAVHEACFTQGALVLMLAPSLRQSAELFRKCLGIMKSVENPLPAIAEESVLRCELENGSRIIALPGSDATVRGYSAATLVVVDEASRVPDSLIAAVRPTLATTGGRMIALSTPAGKRGWFYLEWVNGQGWERTSISAKDCPRITKEWLADEERLLGPHIFEQEYNCTFYDPDTAVFSSEMIERALSADVLPLWGRAA